jgi:hypothetical protein
VAGGQSFLTEIDLSATDHASPAIEKVSGRLTGLAATVASLAGVNLGDFGIETIIHAGTDAVRVFEVLQRNVSGMIYAYMNVSGPQGELADGTERLAKASGFAAEQLDAVRAIAMKLGLEEERTGAAFKGMFQAMTTLGGSSRQQIQFFETLAGASKTLGISLDDAASALGRIAATGTISTRSELGKTLIKLGISNDDIKQMIAAGDGLEQLTGKLSKLADAAKGQVPSFDNAMQRLRNSLKGLGEEAASPALDKIKSLVLDFVSRISTDAGIKGAFGQIGDSLASTAAKLAPLLESIFRLSVKLAEGSAKIADSFASISAVLKPIVDLVGSAVDGLGKWAPAILGAAGALGTFALTAKALLALPGIGALLGGSGGALAGAAGAVAGAAGPAAIVIGATFGFSALYNRAFAAPQQGEADEAYKRAKDQQLLLLKKLAVLAADPEIVAEARAAYVKLASSAASEEVLSAARESIAKLRAAMAGKGQEEPTTTPTILPELLEQIKEKIKGVDAEILKASAGGAMSEKLLGAQSEYVKSRDELDKLAGAWRKNTPEVAALFGALARLRDLKIDQQIRAIADETEKLTLKNKALAVELSQIGLEGTAATIGKAMADAGAKVAELDRQIEQMKRDLGSAIASTNPNDRKAMAAIDEQLQQLSALIDQRALESVKGLKTAQEEIRKNLKSLGEETFKAQVDDLKAQGLDYTAAWDELNHATAERVRLFTQLIESLPKTANFDGLRKALVDGLNAFNAASQAANDRATALMNAESAAQRGAFGEAWDYIAALPARTLPEFRKNMEAWIKVLQDFGTSAGAGVKRAFAEIAKDIRSNAEISHDFVKGVWDDLGSSMKKGLFEAFKGNADGLKDVWKSMLDSFLQRWADVLGEIIQRWLATKLFLGQNSLFGSGTQAIGSPTIPGGSGGTTGESLGGGGGEWGVGADEGATAGGSSGTGYLGYAAAAYGIYAGIKGALKQNKEKVSYGGVDFGEMNFGGDSFGTKLTPWLAAAAAVASTGIGIVVAAVIAVVGIIVSLFNGPKEAHVTFALNKALEGARDGINGLVGNIIDGTANYVGELALKAFGTKAPETVRSYVTAYREQFKKLYGAATFDIAAGSGDDIKKDLDTFFKQILPKMAVQAGFGQVGFGPTGNRDSTGGAAGLDWNINSGFMDREGNWIKKQLYDPEAPIPKMLAGLGFTGDRVKEIAQKLADSSDIEAFKTWLDALVGLVVDLHDLASKFGRTREEWKTAIGDEAKAQGTAAQFQSAIDTLIASGSLLDTVFGDDRVKAGQELVKSSRQLLDQQEAALRSIFETIDQLTTQSAAIATGAREKLMTPAEVEAAARGRLGAEFKAITDAANPREVAAAWQTFAKDLSAVLDQIASRITAIKNLQQQYADFRTAVADRNAPKFATDPDSWLAANAGAIDAQRAALSGLTGDEAIAGAGKLLALVKERYNAVMDMLARVPDTVRSIDESIGKAVEDLQLQSIGSVDASGQWKTDVHGQGDFMMARIKELQGQLPTAKTPEEVQRITNEIQSYVSKLSAQPQDASHYEESRKILIQILKDTQGVADKRLAEMDAKFSKDLEGIGDRLKAGETALKDALGAAEADFEDTLKLLAQATTAAKDGLNAFADALIEQMNTLAGKIGEWITLFTTADATQQPDTSTQPAPGGGGGTGKGPDNPEAPVMAPPVNVQVTVNSGSPEEIAAAAAEAVQGQVYNAMVDLLKTHSVEVVRAIRNNPGLLKAS